jgi:geranylgeranyl diphosphate synthase type I
MGTVSDALERLLDQFSAAVDEQVAALLAELSLPAELDGMVQYHLGWVDEQFHPAPAARGKRVRPAVVFLTCEAAGADWRAALPSAAAVELVHNFSLVHDDIQDRSPLRRHRPSLWARWGDARAINAGDLMFVLAQMAVLRQPGAGAGQSTPARLLNEASARLCAGQHRDLELVDAATPGLDGYYAMIEGKTAALLAAAAELGALAAASPRPAREAYGRFGREVGLAFQLQDDLLDVWGSSDYRGKAAWEDLRARKHSLPIVLARRSASPEQRARLAALYDQPAPLPDDAAEGLVALFEEIGVAAEGERRVRAHFGAALAALREARPRAEAGTLLESLAESLLGRQA